MNTYEWDSRTKSFIEVSDPTFVDGVDNVEEGIATSGYTIQLSSDGENEEGGFIRLYTTNAADKPRYFIDIMGLSEGIATLVARDFPSLIETLRQIHPLIGLVRLDQFATARVVDHIKTK